MRTMNTMEVEESLILQVPAESIIVGHTTRLTSSSGDGAELCDIKKEKELLNSPETNPDKLNPWASLVTPEQTHSKTSPGQSPLIPARIVRPTLQQPPQLKVVGIQHLGRTRGRDRSQEEPMAPGGAGTNQERSGGTGAARVAAAIPLF